MSSLAIRPRARGVLVAAGLGLAGLGGPALGCGEESPARPSDTALVDLALTGVSPTAWLPGTALAIEGDAFVDDPWGTSHLRIRGTSTGPQGSQEIDVSIPARFMDFQRLEAELTHELLDALGGDGATIDAVATVQVLSAVDETTYSSEVLDLGLSMHTQLVPELVEVTPDGLIFPNEPIAIEGADMLLPGEGRTMAIVEGCFAPLGEEECEPLAPTEIPVAVAEADRAAGSFAFAPQIAGIEPGRFEGEVRLQNRHDDETITESEAMARRWDLERPILYGVSTDSASLGQYVAIEGAGFVGGEFGGTLLMFTGAFTEDATGLERPVDVVLLPEFVDGRNVRYVISEDDELGTEFDVRFETGHFEGLITPTIAWQAGGFDQEVAGDPTPIQFSILPVKQVVYVEFLPAYVESLRHFGLRALDREIRDRVLEVLARDYATIGVEIRETPPQDFALFAQVEIGGPDPNGLGLLGYDNTPGKDTENQRLYDRIGGVNALTQEDGFPGYGGVFIESLLGYSEDPAGYAEPIEPNESFDAIFDPFRIERGGMPVRSEDLGDGVTTLSGGQSCPAPEDDRRLQIACAVWTLGSVVGSTIAHEIGHSLGLADPYGPAFHNAGDADDRLMDGDRPFEERAELDGQGPSRFCADEYVYLRAILPTADPEDPTPRPPCY